MLLWFVISYWIISVLIGLWAARRVKNTKDFAIAGRHLPFYMVTATVFATWFGSEAVLGIPATVMEEGFKGVIADPFGSSLCLILFGLFLAAPLYRMKLMTIGDFYRRRYGRTVEVLTTLAIVISYLGWVGAQISALGLVFNIVSNGMISQAAGMWIGSLTILVYTFFGGMWAVAVTDFLQMIIIVIGLVWIGGAFSAQVGGVTPIIEHAAAHGKLNLLPEPNITAIIAFLAALCTMMFGSMPQQDVFQRTQSAQNITGAVWATVLGGVLYFLFTFIPMFIGYSALFIDPALVKTYIHTDPQMILPQLILNHTSLFIQILFFGALLSAIKSCASATLLAPSVTFTSNILGEIFPNMTDQQMLRTMRMVTLVFTLLVTLYALHSDASIFQMVENAYQVTLVGAFIPLVFGVYWRKATNQGALLAVILGISTWLTLLIAQESSIQMGLVEQLKQVAAFLTPQGTGLIASLIGMLVGSLSPQYLDHDPTVFDRLRSGQMQDIDK